MNRRSQQFGAILPLVVVGLGLLFIGLAWNGAAGVLDFRAQFPYLLSGGLVGLGFIILGSSLILTQSARKDRMHLEAKLDRIADLLDRAIADQGPGALPSDIAGLVAAGSASYHVPGCRLVEGRESVEYLTPAEARERSLTPCRVCKPAGEPAAL